MSASRNQLNDYLRTIDISGKTVLDIGVQDKPTSRLTAGNPNTYLTMDIDPQWNPDIVADLNEDWEASKLTQKNDTGPFDIIFAIEVLEHCWNPVQAIKNISMALKKGGTTYISTPFINPHHDVVDYLRYTDEWYRDTLPRLGLQVDQIIERIATSGRELLLGFYTHEAMRVSKSRGGFGKYTFPIGYLVKATKL